MSHKLRNKGKREQKKNAPFATPPRRERTQVDAPRISGLIYEVVSCSQYDRPGTLKIASCGSETPYQRFLVTVVSQDQDPKLQNIDGWEKRGLQEGACARTCSVLSVGGAVGERLGQRLFLGQ